MGSEKLIEGVFTIAGMIIFVAIVSALISNNAQGVQFIQAVGGVFNQALSTALSPINQSSSTTGVP